MDLELENGDISGIIQQTVDMCNDKFIGLLEEEQMRSNRRLGENLAVLEAKWEEKLQSMQYVEITKGKVADMVVVSAITEDAMANWLEVDEAAATYVIQGSAEKMVKEEVATGGDAGTTCAAEPDPTFSFHGDPLLGVDINECWELPSLAYAGWFDEESQQIDEAIHAGVHFSRRMLLQQKPLSYKYINCRSQPW